MQNVFRVSVLVSAALWCASCALVGDRAALTKDRAMARLQALTLAEKIAERADPAEWDAALYLGTTALERAAQVYVGSSTRYEMKDSIFEGARVELRRVKVDTTVGELSADLYFAAASRQGKVRAEVKWHGPVRYVGTEKKSDKEMFAVFRIEPVDIPVRSNLIPFGIGETAFVSRLIADLVYLKTDPENFTFRLPMPAEVTLPVGMNTAITQKVGKEGGTITLEAKMLGGDLKFSLPYAAAFVEREGIWICAGAPVEPPVIASYPGDDPATLERIRQEIARKEDHLRPLYDRTRGGQEIEFFVSRKLIDALFGQLVRLPEANRTVAFVGVNGNGDLYLKRYRDNVLGDGGFKVGFQDTKSVQGWISMAFDDLTWEGAKIHTRVRAHAEMGAALHVHFDPLVGGGIGTKVGVNGRGDLDVGVALRPGIVTGDGASCAAVELDVDCNPFQFDLATDGVLKTGPIKISVAQVGLRYRNPLFSHAPAGITLLDQRAYFYAPKPRKLPPKSDWKETLSFDGLTATFEPTACRALAAGLVIDARLDLKPQRFATSNERSKLEQEIAGQNRSLIEHTQRALARSAEQRTCPKDEFLAVLVDDLEFGPNNDVVKAIRDLETLGRHIYEEAEKIGKTPGKALADMPENVRRELTKGVEELGTAVANAPRNISRELGKALDAANKEAERLQQNVQREGRVIIKEAGNLPNNVKRELGNAAKKVRKFLGF